MELKFKALSPKIGTEIPVPAYATAGSAGLDLRACIDAPRYIPGQKHGGWGTWKSVLIPTGLAAAIPEGYVGLIFARSGLGVKHGVVPANCVGVIDSDYRGEIMVGLFNHGGEDYLVKPGDRIAQLVIVPAPQMDISLVEELDDTGRGVGGFGSTGKA